MSPSAPVVRPSPCKAVLEAIPADGRPVVMDGVITASGYASRVAWSALLQLVTSGIVHAWRDGQYSFCRRKVVTSK